jgi:hypothetical protein
MIRIICGECGSDNVRRDAWAEWDIDAQRWVLGSVFDQGFCEACGEERSLDEEEIGVTREDPVPAPAITTSSTGDVHAGCGGIWRQDPACDLADLCDKCGEGRA